MPANLAWGLLEAKDFWINHNNVLFTRASLSRSVPLKKCQSETFTTPRYFTYDRMCSFGTDLLRKTWLLSQNLVADANALAIAVELKVISGDALYIADATIYRLICIESDTSAGWATIRCVSTDLVVQGQPWRRSALWQVVRVRRRASSRILFRKIVLNRDDENVVNDFVMRHRVYL